jgi:rhamnose utilization protein RhaD (predicted bifunctional aldolase and dehydrogenase)/NAD(P)-dependent dehydrogenase (short-subunit alcohol dehydrogenase family)
MQNLWSDRDAKAAVKAHAEKGIGEDLALRVYTTRLLGGEPRLVQHGGGNTSVKTTMRDVSGEMVEVLCVKGSGWDMGTIEAPGLPAVRLEALRKLAKLDSLSDEAMVNAQRAALLDSNAPNPSVEALLHAFLPHKFIDHTHANAILALSDQPDGDEICAKLFGKRVAIVPYLMPGFGLAKLAKQVFDANPHVEGLLLARHGFFTMGDTAREAYDRHIEFVSMAEARIAKGRKKVFKAVPLPKRLADPAEVAPFLRGLLAQPVDKDAGHWRRVVLDHRAGPAVMDFVNSSDIWRVALAGTVTPDHVIRTKPRPLILPAPEAGKIAEFKEAAKAALESYIADYTGYFERHNAKANPKKKPLDPYPRVVMVRGLGLFGVAKTKKDAAIAADIAETNVQVITDAERVGRYETIPEADQFDVEYWSLEQAKLGKAADKPLTGQIVAITGGAGGIGLATARAFKAEGAEIVLLDLAAATPAGKAKTIGGIGIDCDVTSPASVAAAFAEIRARLGGLDILVSNAGAAWSGKIGEVDDAVLRQSFELNFFAHQNVAKAAVAIMLEQGTGGCLLFNVSKQAVNPGPDFGPYGLPKAATLFLSRQYALDYGAAGIRANAVNADRIRSGLLTDEMVAKRSKARGVSEKDYMSGNLLGREVKAEDVAQAFVQLALAQKTTAAVMTVDGGNIAAALR